MRLHMTDNTFSPGLKNIYCEIIRSGSIEDIKAVWSGLLEQYSVLHDLSVTNRTEEIIKRVCDFVNQNYHRDITLAEIAQPVYLSASYLSTIFHANTGVSLFKYVTEVRLTHATELLINSGKRVKDISHEVGYNSPQSFVRAFKKKYGLTPDQYRLKNSISDIGK